MFVQLRSQLAASVDAAILLLRFLFHFSPPTNSESGVCVPTSGHTDRLTRRFPLPFLDSTPETAGPVIRRQVLANAVVSVSVSTTPGLTVVTNSESGLSRSKTRSNGCPPASTNSESGVSLYPLQSKPMQFPGTNSESGVPGPRSLTSSVKVVVVDADCPPVHTDRSRTKTGRVPSQSCQPRLEAGADLTILPQQSR